jgi:hypothetical protein
MSIGPARVPTTVIAVVWLASVALMVAVAVQNVTDPGVLLRDPQATTESPWYLGAVSTFGIVGWAVASTIFGVGAVLFWWLRQRRTAWFLGAACVLTGFLLLDDLLLVHENLAERFLGSDVPIYVFYAVSFLAWFAVFRTEIIRGPMIAGLLAGVALAASAIIDVALADVGDDWRLILEDGAKFAGIWSWVAYAAMSVGYVIGRSGLSPDHVSPTAQP